jgi:hypothetical protein
VKVRVECGEVEGDGLVGLGRPTARVSVVVYGWMSTP